MRRKMWLHLPEKAARGGARQNSYYPACNRQHTQPYEPTSRMDYYVRNNHAQLANTTTPNVAGMANMSAPMPRTSSMAAHVSYLACFGKKIG
jgi:hypothetical protein